MNRNAKIAIGCGGAGCLGLIVVVIAGGLIYYFNQSSTNRNYNYNSNSNYNSNYNSNDNSNLNSNTDSDSSSMTEDDKHKLYQAAAATKDNALNRRVWIKLGLLDESGSPNESYGQFLKDHISWLFRNSEFLQTIDTPEKARDYVEAHMDD